MAGLPPQPPPRHPQALDYSPPKRKADGEKRNSLTALAQAALQATAASGHQIQPNLSRSRSSQHVERPTLSRQTSSSSEVSAFSLILDGNELEDDATATERESLAKALRELEQIEIAEFLSRSSKYLAEVGVVEERPKLRLAKPPPLANTLKQSIDDYAVYCVDCLRQIGENLPADLLCSTKPKTFSIRATRASMERIYVLLPPPRLSIITQAIYDLYTWQNPKRTLTFAAIYLFAVISDLVPALLTVGLIFLLTKERLSPPKAARLREAVKKRKQSSKEAQNLSKDLKRRAELGALGHLAANAAMVGLKMGDSAKSSPLESSQDGSSSERSGIIGLLRQLSERYGPAMTTLLEDICDMIEKIKNLILWRRPAACRRTVFLLSVIAIFFIVTPIKLVLRGFFLWLDFHFFVVLQLQDKHPQFRRALFPIWWLVIGIPTDADAALQLLQQRASNLKQAKHRKNGKTSVDLRNDASVLSFLMESGKDKTSSDLDKGKTDRWSIYKEKVAATSKSGLSRFRRTLSDTSQLVTAAAGFTNDSDSDSDTDEGSYFGLLHAIPGRIEATRTDLTFTAMKGFHRLALTKPAFSNAPTILKGSGEKSRQLLRIPLSAIVKIGKASSLQDGATLAVTLSDDRVLNFTKVKNREFLWTSLVAWSPNTFAAIRRC